MNGERAAPAGEGTLLGRAMAAGWAHPAIVTVREGTVFDITSREAPTSRDVCEKAQPAAYVAEARGKPICSLSELMENSRAAGDPSRPRLLSPVDLQAV